MTIKKPMLKSKKYLTVLHKMRAIKTVCEGEGPTPPSVVIDIDCETDFGLQWLSTVARTFREHYSDIFLKIQMGEKNQWRDFEKDTARVVITSTPPTEEILQAQELQCVELCQHPVQIKRTEIIQMDEEVEVERKLDPIKECLMLLMQSGKCTWMPGSEGGEGFWIMSNTYASDVSRYHKWRKKDEESGEEERAAGQHVTPTSVRIRQKSRESMPLLTAYEQQFLICSKDIKNESPLHILVDFLRQKAETFSWIG